MSLRTEVTGRFCVKTIRGNASFKALIWMDRDQHYFLLTCTSLVDEDPHVQESWYQLDNSPQTIAQQVQFVVP